MIAFNKCKAKILTENLEKYYSDKRLWQGIPSIVVTDKGRILVAFYSGGDNEQLGNYCMLVKSDDGINFSQPITVFDAGKKSRCFDPCLYYKEGKLWFFWAQMPKMRTFVSVCENPDDSELIWSEPIYVSDGIMLNKPLETKSGKTLLPVAVWDWNLCKNMLRICDKVKIRKPAKKQLAYAVLMENNRFKMLGGVRSRFPSFDEHMFIEKNDGIIRSYIRTTKNIEISESKDEGLSWSDPCDSGIKNPNSRFFIGRLKSGNILFINHYNFKGRNNLTAFISKDDGKTFEGGLLLDERSYVSYPDACEHDGYIYVTYDRERGAKNQKLEISAKEILMAKFTEDDIVKGNIQSDKSYLKRIVSKLN